jgi:hypothetical protein
MAHLAPIENVRIRPIKTLTEYSKIDAVSGYGKEVYGSGNYIN